MTGGAVAAAAVAARARRIQSIIDAFRLADATAPGRARSLAEVGAEGDALFDVLVNDGVVVAGPEAGTWYLSEAGFVAQREARRGFLPRPAIIAITLAIVLLLAILVFRANSRA